MVIRVAFAYNVDWTKLSKTHSISSMYNFFMKALKRNHRLDVKYFPCEKEFDVQKASSFDVILLPDLSSVGAPTKLKNRESTNIPVIAMAGDPHNAHYLNKHDYYEKNKITHCFFQAHSDYFYKFYPKSYPYTRVPIGFEPEHYEHIPDFKERIKHKILLTGSMPNPKWYRRKIRIMRAKLNNNYIHDTYSYYRLRTKCRLLKYVEYKHDNNYPLLLSNYRSSIAAVTVFPVAKCVEIPAAGCLSLIEITKSNGCDLLKFKDNENAIFINEKNYKKKFEEYLADVDNPKWAEIAAAGREYVMNNFTNDHCIDILVDLMAEYAEA